MSGVSSVGANETVLQVTTNVDPKKFDISKYDEFLDLLCDERDYQRESIEEAVRFFLGGEYQTTAELAEVNFKDNTSLQKLYTNFANLRSHLDFPDKLSCTLHLATATGKTWSMYGIAQIMLAEGHVDKVLVLCPSLTIEKQLTKRFGEFSQDPNLKSNMPFLQNRFR